MDERAGADNGQDWRIYIGTGRPQEKPVAFPDPPPWRTFTGSGDESYMQRVLARGAVLQMDELEVNLVNAALILRRPLLITGKPGSGKSSLAYSVANELELGDVLRWPITSRTTLADGLYRYDAIGRLQDTSLEKSLQAASLEKRRTKDNDAVIPDIGRYIQLGPLGTAFLPRDKPRVLLIDEIDKGDIDLPNDLLNIFEEGEFEIPELRRMARKKEATDVEIYDEEKKDTTVSIHGGVVHCRAFPFIVLTSNGEREFPPAFLRRCIQLEMKSPDSEKLLSIVKAHLGPEVSDQVNQLINYFVEERKKGHLAVDQLLNVIYLLKNCNLDIRKKEDLSKALLQHLSYAGMP